MNTKHDYQEFNPPYYWEKFNCHVLDSWYDELGTRHHTCLGEHVEDGFIWNSAIIHKGVNNV